MTDLFNQQLDSIEQGTLLVWYKVSRVSEYNGNRKIAFKKLLSIFTYANEHDPIQKKKRTSEELIELTEDIVDEKVKMDLMTETTEMCVIDPNKDRETQRKIIESKSNFIAWVDLKYITQNNFRKKTLSID